MMTSLFFGSRLTAPRGPLFGTLCLLTVISFQTIGLRLGARDLKFHGPILQWHRDPLTSVTITWVEDINPGPTPVWSEGPAGFGYGDNGEVTVLEDMRGNYERVYLNKTFQLDRIPPEAELKLVVHYDDAFVAWLNGVEIGSSENLLLHHYRDTKVRGRSRSEEQGETIIIENAHGFLVEGENVLAVEGHNHRKWSRDFLLDPVLIMGGEEIVPSGATWKYLAGETPPARWFLKDPRTSPATEPPRRETADWSLGIRPRGGAAFRAVDIEERALADTADRVLESVVGDLRPGEEYEYILEAGNERVHEGWFRTAPRRLSRPVNFVTGGDMGTGTAIPLCRVAAREDPLFAVIGGDLAYANGRLAFRWHDWMDNWSEFVVGRGGREIPVIAGIGNHEMKSQLHFLSPLRFRRGGAPYYFSLFDLPDGHSNFTVDFADYLSVVMLDSDHAQKIWPQTLWLRGQLEQRRTLPHLFAVYHRPAWGTGVKRNSRAIQRQWCPLFERYGVDCAFENDHHVYKRTQKIVGGVPDDERGVLYLGDGAWGALRPVEERDLARVNARNYLAEWESRLHLIKVKIYPDGRKHYQALGADGSVFDEFRDRGTPAREGAE